jgi:hypothetical protein
VFDATDAVEIQIPAAQEVPEVTVTSLKICLNAMYIELESQDRIRSNWRIDLSAPSGALPDIGRSERAREEKEKRRKGCIKPVVGDCGAPVSWPGLHRAGKQGGEGGRQTVLAQPLPCRCHSRPLIPPGPAASRRGMPLASSSRKLARKGGSGGGVYSRQE